MHLCASHTCRQGPDSDYYLGLDKAAVLGNGTDVLGNTILDCGFVRGTKLEPACLPCPPCPAVDTA